MMRVVVIEDELAARRGLVDLLNDLAPRVTVVGAAANGKQGLSSLHALMPDVAFVDIRMPEMDGLEMIRLAKEQGLTVEFVLVTAYAEFEYARQALKLGVMEYLLKPITTEELFSVICRLMPEAATASCDTIHHPMVDKTLKLIRDGYRTPINLTTISEQLQISPEYISYLFHRDMGINFSTYLRQYRIDRAYEMMSGGNMRIYEIAHAVGFNDAKYFCRVFREVTGKSPGAFLKEHEGNAESLASPDPAPKE
ncbi:MAG: response regulator [Clostridia bacterium]